MTEATYFSELKRQLKADAPFHLLVVLYGCAGLALAIYLGRPEKLQALMYARRFETALLVLISVIVVWQALWSLKSPSPTRELWQRLQKIFTPPVVARGLLFVNIAIFYGIFTSFKRMLSDLRSYSYDETLADIDRAIHGQDPWLWLPHGELLTRLVQIFYLQGWLLCLVGFSCYVILFQSRELVCRYVATFYLAWAFLGTIMAGTFMSAGPVYYQNITGKDRFVPLLEKMEPTFLLFSSSVTVQDRLWEDYMLDLGLLGSGISAFPSLHVAMATLWALTAWSINKVLFGILLFVLILVQFSSVYLGWHYAVDGYFSFTSVIVMWLLVARICRFGTRQSLQLDPNSSPEVSCEKS